MKETEQYTASLHWRNAIANAASYVKYLNDYDAEERSRVEQFFGVVNGELLRWATERIDEILTVAAELWPLFPEYQESALSVAQSSVDALRERGWSGIVPTVDITRISTPGGEKE
jgi:hypothetical protein